MFTTSLDKKGDVSGFHNENYFFNDRNLINPLLSATIKLQFGRDLCFHQHIELVFQIFQIKEHGLRIENVNQKD